jgi:hypothetical protein
MRSACLIALIAGCGFSSVAGSPGAEPGIDSGPAGSGEPNGPGGSGGPVGGCDTSDPSLRLCLTFDQTPMKVTDLINPVAHTVADDFGVTQVLGLASGAAQLAPASRIRFTEHPDFDVAELTVDLWIAPAALVAKQHYWLLDNNTQYFAIYEGDGSVRCGIGTQTSVSSRARFVPTIPASWHHVACTYAASREVRVYVDGDLSGCTTGPSAIPQSGTDGVAIGANYGSGSFHENFVGGLDAVHIYGRAMQATEVCSAAHRTGCDNQCPSTGSGPGPGPDDGSHGGR